jgi:SAM-dependent methyltransferase
MSSLDWMKRRDDSREPLPEIDVTVPTIARTYDAILGGKDNYVVDREAGQAFIDNVPGARECALENREILVRGVQYLAGEAGMDQFLDIGAGLPTMKNTHEAAQEINPRARVVYVDNDPVVLAHGRALLATNDTTTVITADLRDPQSILTHPETNRMLDFDRPIALMIVGLLMHLHDDERPNELIAELVDALAPESHLFITSWCDTGEPEQAALEKVSVRYLGNGYKRTVPELLQHFVGLPLIEPGLVYLAQWRPHGPVPKDDELVPFQRLQMAGIARKP